MNRISVILRTAAILAAILDFMVVSNGVARIFVWGGGTR